jgi:hypothetical protein
VRAAVDDLDLLDVAAPPAGHLRCGAGPLDGAPDGGALPLQRRAVRGHDDGHAEAGLAGVGGEVEGAAVDADVELGGGRAGRLEPPRPPADRELGVAVRAQRVRRRAVEEVRAVGQRLQRERHVVRAQVLHRDLLVLGAVVVRRLRRRRRGEEHGHRRHQQGRRRGLGHRRHRRLLLPRSRRVACPLTDSERRLLLAWDGFRVWSPGVLLAWDGFRV